VLIGWVVGVVVVLGTVALVLVLRRSREDVHSVEHYHRQLHTLEEIRTHPSEEPRNGGNGRDAAGFPASAFRVSGSSTVRLTESGRAVVPPVPPPPVPNPDEPMTFDDAGPEPVPATFMTGTEDRVIHSINHRPRRIGGPAAAVAAVLVLIAVLIVTGLHSTTPKHPGKSAGATTTTPAHAGTGHHHVAATTSTTSTTAPSAVSPPTTASAHAATYTVSATNYALDVVATVGECWVEVTDTTTGSVLFTGTLQSGQSHTVSVSGPVTVIAGAPGAFGATVNGAPVTLPPGNQAPFTLTFQSASPTAAA
jgi:RodZ C-terminal domain